MGKVDFSSQFVGPCQLDANGLTDPEDETRLLPMQTEGPFIVVEKFWQVGNMNQALHRIGQLHKESKFDHA